MARPGVIHDRDETPAASVSGSSFSIGLAPDAASSPDPEAMFVVCHELLGRLRLRAPRQTLLYVDVNGVALVDAKTKRCVSRAAFNELTSWCAVDAHVFELKQLGVKTRKLESRRFEMTRGVAAELCAALRSRVRLYVERPDEVRRLRATAAGFRAGDRVCRETLARARALGDGGGETAFRGEAVASASRYEKTPSAKFRLESVNSEVLRVASATPGERLARAGARRRLPRARDPSQVREVPRDAPATETSSGDSPGGGFGFFGFGDERTVGEGDASTGAAGTFVDGVGLDDASLRAAYARREAAYAKLREEEDAAWAASRIERSESESESDGDDAFSFGEKNVEAKSPTEPPSDAPSARGFRARERARELARERARAAERSARPPPPLFDATLANPPAAAEEEDPEAWLGAADYFYEDETDEDALPEGVPGSGARGRLEGYVPVPVSPCESPLASARTPSGARGGGRSPAAPDPESERLNRRVRGFAGALRDSLVSVGRARSDADVRAECAALIDRLRRFTAEGVAEEEGFAG